MTPALGTVDREPRQEIDPMKRSASLYAIAAAAVLAFTLHENEASAAEKKGPFTTGGEIGFGYFFGDVQGASFVFAPYVGYGLYKNNAYLLFAPQIQAGQGNGAFITLPAGFQYDFELVKGLYLYPRVTAGVSFATGGGNPFFTGGACVGLRYEVLPILHVGGEPLCMNVHATDGATAGQYQFLAGAGVDL
jgi:hypothetical protein